MEQLELEASNWEKANRLRGYIHAVENKMRNEHPNKLPHETVEWISWATKHANDIDPIK